MAPPETALPGPTNAAGERQAPPQVKSFSEGVKAKSLGDILKKAEDLMKEGKWFNAAEQYDVAQAVAPNNMLFAVAKANAELGGSYYGRAENDLRRAFTQDPATLEGTYDLRAMIGDERLDFLVKDLKEIANKNPTQARPMFLLAYIQYNIGNGRFAAGYLDIAEKRAGGNDTFYSLVRKHWVLPKGEAPAPDLNK
jgi:tetratricopeptide (TPR) repeat protein